MNKWCNAVLIILAFVASGASGCGAATKETGELAAGPVTGDQWLAMSSSQRNDAVYEYIQGYLDGVNQACSKADSLFETNIAHQLRYHDRPSNFPSDRCRSSAAQYSKMTVSANNRGYDYSAYTRIITEFYQKRLEYRKIQLVILMHHLTDQEFKNADELYAMAKHGDIGPL
jgi:hypothetical protein